MAESRPSLLIVGDSHAIALKAGCDAIGLDAELLSFSGNLWHRGFIVHNRRRGLWAKGRALQARIEKTCERLGCENLLKSGVPVLASFGFHLGRIVSPFVAQSHTTDSVRFRAEGASNFVSHALTQAYVDHFRGDHTRMLRAMSRATPTLAVAPPITEDGVDQITIREVIKDRLTANDVAVLDPCPALFQPQGRLPDAYRAEDGRHGNDAYGTMVIRYILDRDLLGISRR